MKFESLSLKTDRQHVNVMLFVCGQMGGVPERIAAFHPPGGPERGKKPENNSNPSGIIYDPLGPTYLWKNDNKTQSGVKPNPNHLHSSSLFLRWTTINRLYSQPFPTSLTAEPLLPLADALHSVH